MRFYLISSTVLIAASIVFMTTSGIADSKKRGKYEQLYRYQQSKSILPFKDILKMVRPLIKGEIIETEFEIDHGIPIYEFKYIHKFGHIREMYVDARTGKVIKDEID